MRRALFTLLALLGAPASAAAHEAVEPGTAPPVEPVVAEAFPVAGKVTYGEFGARFGGGRGHDGQDVLAACGTPVVAARAGTVKVNKSEGAAGHYLVVRREGGGSDVYMHLRSPSPRREGERVAAGQRLGSVGDTGRASTCHLHFETWTAPGWYAGGRAVDPLPLLRRLGRSGD